MREALLLHGGPCLDRKGRSEFVRLWLRVDRFTSLPVVYMLKIDESQLVSHRNKKYTEGPNEFSFGLVCCVCLRAGVGEGVAEELRGE